MLDIGWTELLVIAVVAIIVVGPKDLPRMLRSLGRTAGQLKRTANEFREQFDDALRESELDELRTTMDDVSDLNPVNQIKNSISEGFDPLRETADDLKGEIEDLKSGAGTETSEAPAQVDAVEADTADGDDGPALAPKAEAEAKS
ncbi:MAG: Sec-independent protein translocase protein TatB [Methyloligellaceae bacterium]